MYSIVIQLIADQDLTPKKTLLRKWARTALISAQIAAAEVTIRIVDTQEMTELNSNYRHKAGPTNVLSFPFELAEDIPLTTPILGDIVVCAAVVATEAKHQGKSLEAHWAHMIVHGIYHLLGYDHETDQEADIMEELEIIVMKKLGYANPYATGEHIKDHE